MTYSSGRARMVTAAVLLALVSFITLTGANVTDPIIRKIEFTGNDRTPTDTVKMTISSIVGSRFNPATVDRDIKALYALGQFRDIRVDMKNVSGGVELTYVLTEKPMITEIEFEGNRKIKSDDLRAEVAQRVYSTLDDKAIAESMEKIRALYSKKGYYLADVSYHLDTNEKGETILVFDIHERKRVIVRKVLFIGNEVFSDDELRGVIKTRQKDFLSFLTGSGKYEEEELKNDVLRLTYHYLNHGYLKVKIAPPKTTITRDKRYIFVTYQIYEGKQYRIGDVEISGDILTTREQIRDMLKMKTGDIYSQRVLDEDVMNITDAYGDEGYAFATIMPDTIPDDETLTADINIIIAKGNRITIEKINIFGNTTTRDKVIRRELEVMESDRYNTRLIRKSRENLMRLGYFEDVNFATPRGSRDDTVNLNITVKEKSTGSFNIGAGFSSIEHFIFNASIQKENFFGYGISGALSMELSSMRQLFMLSAQDPYFLDSEWSAGFSVYRNSYKYLDFKRDSTGGDVNLGHRFFDNCSFSLGYQAEQVDVTDFSYVVPQMFRENANGFTSELSFSLARDTRNNRIMPTKGTYNILQQEVSGNKLGGNNDFYRINFRSMFYQPIWKQIVFKQFFRAGYIDSLNDKPVPLFERFFTGGVNSLRGFYPNSIGPSLRIPVSPSGPEENFVYGGDKLLLFVSEIEIPVFPKGGIATVAFFDAGNAYAENQNFSLTNIRADYGFGLRWNSPMGPLRFEWGIPIDRKPGEDSVVFNFTIGSFF